MPVQILHTEMFYSKHKFNNPNSLALENEYGCIKADEGSWSETQQPQFGSSGGPGTAHDILLLTFILGEDKQKLK